MSKQPLNASICLSMIVKDEAHIIERCLRSVRPLLSSWVIVDTGSTDDTEAVVQKVLAGLDGVYVRRPWVDFSTNRNQALELSRSKGDYSLVMDADDELILPDGYVLPELYRDLYSLWVDGVSVAFTRPHLFGSAFPFRYIGAVHEAVRPDPAMTHGILEGPRYRIHHNEGGRSRVPGSKFARDAALLEASLRNDPNNAKDVFFLARSYQSAGDVTRSIAAYERYASMPVEDVDQLFAALLDLATLRVQSGAPMLDVVTAFLRAHAASPRRAEALHGLAAHCRFVGDNARAHVFASAAMTIPRPLGENEGAYLLQASVYDYGVLEEYSLASWALGFVDESRRVDKRIVDEGLAPGSVVAAARARLGLPPTDARWAPVERLEQTLETGVACGRLFLGVL